MFHRNTIHITMCFYAIHWKTFWYTRAKHIDIAFKNTSWMIFSISVKYQVYRKGSFSLPWYRSIKRSIYPWDVGYSSISLTRIKVSCNVAYQTWARYSFYSNSIFNSQVPPLLVMFVWSFGLSDCMYVLSDCI